MIIRNTVAAVGVDETSNFETKTRL